MSRGRGPVCFYLDDREDTSGHLYFPLSSSFWEEHVDCHPPQSVQTSHRPDPQFRGQGRDPGPASQSPHLSVPHEQSTHALAMGSELPKRDSVQSFSQKPLERKK